VVCCRGVLGSRFPTIMRHFIQPVVEKLGINQRVTWHTFRRTHTALLHANGEEVKRVPELSRHGLSRTTTGIYAQAQMPAERAAQQKVVEVVLSENLRWRSKRWLNCSPVEIDDSN